jgi:CO dehydrogenase maturation factor
LLLIVSDTSRRGIQSAARISDLTQELKLNIGRSVLIINQARDEQVEGLREALEGHPLPIIGIVPEDVKVRDFDLQGRPTVELGAESRALNAAYGIFEKVLNH